MRALEPTIALTILFCVYAAGEFIVQKIKTVFSTVLGIAILLLAGLWGGTLPRSVIEDTQVTGFDGVIAGILVVFPGTTIDFPELWRQWKVVATPLVCVVGATLAIILIDYPPIGKEMALSVAPIFVGGSVATLITTTALDEMGLVTTSTPCIVTYVVQKSIDVPIASLLLWCTVVQLRDNSALVAEYSQQQEIVAGSRRNPLQLPASFARPSVHLTKLGLVAVVAHFPSELTGGAIHYFIPCLVTGVVFFALGFLERGIMSKTQFGDLITFFITILIFSNLTTTTPQQVLSVLPALLLSTACGVAGTMLLGFTCVKVMNFPSGLAASFGTSCIFGFPTTMLIPQEVAEAFGRTETEKVAILNYLLPEMPIAGFVTATIASVFIAGVVVRTL